MHYLVMHADIRRASALCSCYILSRREKHVYYLVGLDGRRFGRVIPVGAPRVSVSLLMPAPVDNTLSSCLLAVCMMDTTNTSVFIPSGAYYHSCCLPVAVFLWGELISST